MRFSWLARSLDTGTEHHGMHPLFSMVLRCFGSVLPQSTFGLAAHHLPKFFCGTATMRQSAFVCAISMADRLMMVPWRMRAWTALDRLHAITADLHCNAAGGAVQAATRGIDPNGGTLNLVVGGIMCDICEVRAVGALAEWPGSRVPQQADQRLDGCHHLRASVLPM